MGKFSFLAAVQKLAAAKTGFSFIRCSNIDDLLI